MSPGDHPSPLRRVLVTGASGYVGSRLVSSLRAGSEVDVRAVIRRDTPWVGGDDVRVVDLFGDAAACQAAFAGVDAVVHLAGPNEVQTRDAPDEAMAMAIALARRVARAAVASGAARVVVVSTVHVYGRALAEDAVVDEHALPEPRNDYAVARLAAEHVVATVTEGTGTDVVVARLTNGVGAPVDPRVERWTLVVNDLCRQAATRGLVELRTHGLQWRDFVALSDVCRILATATDPERLPAGTYNLASGIPATVRDVASMVQDAFEHETGRRPPLVAPDPPCAAPRPYRVSAERLAAHGLAAEEPLAAAVAETARFCLDHRHVLEERSP